MPFTATVLNVMIATPSDVIERSVIASAIYEWNALNSADSGYVLLPVGWELHAAPAMGDRPQGILMHQFVRNCDMLIGVFWTRFGTPTGVAGGGTEEEINYFLKNKKPTMLYFCDRPIPPAMIDHDQMKALANFRSSIRNRGFQDDYSGADDFKSKLIRHITLITREISFGATVDKDVVKRVEAQSKDDDPSNGQGDPIRFENYTDKAFIVFGDTRSLKEKLQEKGGKWIKSRTGNFGWMFSKKRLEEVAEICSLPAKLHN